MNSIRCLVSMIFGISIFCTANPAIRGIVYPFHESIPIYETATSFNPKTYLVSGNTDYSFYWAYVIEDSYLRFKAKFISTSDNKDSTETFVGWINKTNVVVKLLENDFDKDGGFLYLYDSPNSQNKEKSILRMSKGKSLYLNSITVN